jgi:predicted Rossmann fold flavoprotein
MVFLRFSILSVKRYCKTFIRITFAAMRFVVIGGGAAGFFAAIRHRACFPQHEVIILERGAAVLQKVKVSGGGRCNVTHACFDARELVKHYPRGERELLGPFTHFGPKDTVNWFEERGVQLKTESDGRMFPTTDLSQTIIDCLTGEARRLNVQLRLGSRVTQIHREPSGDWRISIGGQPEIVAQAVLIATGSSEAVWTALADLGHEIVAPVPSLFTFNVKDPRLRDLAGVSVPLAQLEVPALKLKASGPLLVTHWGLSGPAILRLSAWGARLLHGVDYRFQLRVNWTGTSTTYEILEQLMSIKAATAKKQVATHAQLGLPIRLWTLLVAAAGIDPTTRWADLDKRSMQALVQELGAGMFNIAGKSTFKEEFVTAGGVNLKEINFKTFSSKLFPNLFFAGEVLNIDAITGGFNFQAAWTGGWIAGGVEL